MRLRSFLVVGAALVVLASATTLALASRRIHAEQAAYSVPSAGRCTPSTLNASAVLPGTGLAVSPLPDSYDASTQTQISLLGAPPGAIGAVHVSGSADRLALRAPARLLPGRRRQLRARARVRAGRDRDRARNRQGRRQRAAVRLPLRRRPPGPRGLRRRRRRKRAARLRRDAALPFAPGTGAARARRHAALPQATPGDLFAAAYSGPGAERADDLRRIRQPRLVPPAAEGDRSHQPAGAAVRRPAGADLVAGTHPAAGLRPGRRDHRQQRLPGNRPRTRRQRLPRRPARIPHHRRRGPRC